MASNKSCPSRAYKDMLMIDFTEMFVFRLCISQCILSDASRVLFDNIPLFTFL